jgi:hypothetical protein
LPVFAPPGTKRASCGGLEKNFRNISRNGRLPDAKLMLGL